jgi:hypothetical protein
VKASLVKNWYWSRAPLNRPSFVVNLLFQFKRVESLSNL